jgi:integrase
MGKKRLLKSLGTTDLRKARVARWKALDELKTAIAHAGGATMEDQQAWTNEAMAWREEFIRADAPKRNELVFPIIERAEQIDLAAGGTGSNSDHDPFDEPTPATNAASDFVRLATGQATPTDAYVERWLAASDYSERTKADARTAMRQFLDWARKAQQGVFIEAVTDRVASDFRDEVFVQAKVHPKTANKKLSALRQYWEWMNRSFGIKANPWMRKSLPKPRKHRVAQDGPFGDERPFTDAEIVTLLNGPADQEMSHFMRIASLSGLRLDEIGQLRVTDCSEGQFAVVRSKTAAGLRSVPIHTKLKPLVASLTDGRDPKVFLFPDLSESGWDGNRTMALSKRFAYYRKKLGVHDKRPGSRRSKVNFHSFRRWFTTKAEDAGIRENVVSAILGHEEGQGITFGVYSKAELLALKSECVEAVQLPPESFAP